LGDETSADIQARIKKIMQMDEEVGKLASATPVMICMSLPYHQETYDAPVPPALSVTGGISLARGAGTYD